MLATREGFLSLSARDIYQHPRWRYNLAGFSREESMKTTTTMTTSHCADSARFFPTGKHFSLSLSPSLPLVATLLSAIRSPRTLLLLLRLLFASPPHRLYALCGLCAPRTASTWVTAKAARLRAYFSTSTPTRRLSLSREIEDFARLRVVPKRYVDDGARSAIP